MEEHEKVIYMLDDFWKKENCYVGLCGTKEYCDLCSLVSNAGNVIPPCCDPG